MILLIKIGYNILKLIFHLKKVKDAL